MSTFNGRIIGANFISFFRRKLWITVRGVGSAHSLWHDFPQRAEAVRGVGSAHSLWHDFPQRAEAVRGVGSAHSLWHDFPQRAETVRGVGSVHSLWHDFPYVSSVYTSAKEIWHCIRFLLYFQKYNVTLKLIFIYDYKQICAWVSFICRAYVCVCVNVCVWMCVCMTYLSYTTDSVLSGPLS